MKKQRNDEDAREQTRATLARDVLWLLGVVAVGLLILTGLERKLGLSPEAIGTLRSLLAAVFTLATMAFVFYFKRRK